MPHRKHEDVVAVRSVVDVIPTAPEQHATRTWHRGMSIWAADVWSMTDDVERRGQFLDKEVW
jgi:hypothetical protein